jgi:hypothetical protein
LIGSSPTPAQAPEPINFDLYRKQLNAPGVVDAFEKAYTGTPPKRPPRVSALTLPAPGLKLPAYAGKEAEELAAAFAALDKEAAAAEAVARKRIGELEAELAALAVEKEKLKTVTLDEVLAADPALAAKVNEDIRADKWY